MRSSGNISIDLWLSTLIYNASLSEHQRHISLVLEKLGAHKLHLKLENQQGVQMDQRKVETIRN